MAETEITFEIKRPLTWVLFGILLAVLASEFALAYYSPIAFGDEGLYIHLGRWMAQYKDYPATLPLFDTKLQQSGNFKAPFLMFIEGGIFMLFGFSEIIAKFLFPFIGFLTALGVFLLGKRIFSEKVAFFASILTVTASVFITYSVLFYVEIFSAFMFVIGGLLLILHANTKEKKYLILSAVFLAFGLLTKIPNYASLIFLVLMALYEILESRKITLDIVNRYGLIFLIAIGIVSTFFIRNYILYGVPSCEMSFGMANKCSPSFNYTPVNVLQGSADSGGTANSLLSFGILQYLDFSIGTVWFLPLLFVCGLAAIFLKRERNYLLLALLLLSIVPVFYKTLSSRVEETSRFTIGIIPIMGLVAGLYLEKLTDAVGRFHKYLPTIALISIILIAFMNFGIGFPYEGSNGLSVFWAVSGKLAGLVPVKAFVPSFFTVCDWVKANPDKVPKDAIMLSFQTTPTVYNCERDAMWNTPDLSDILSSDINVSLPRLQANGYTHIFVQMFSVATGNQGGSYPLSFVQMLQSNPQHFTLVYSVGDSVDTCAQKLNSGQPCDGGLIYAINYTGAG
jgi:4-amino-4-deoxy-L-arabinose transferase-like glycosyltransferase